jgi:hypothetical protein
VLLNGVNEMPISGHKLTRESPEEDLHMGRIKSDNIILRRALHREDDAQHCQSPVIVEAGNTGRQNLVFTGRSSPDVPSKEFSVQLSIGRRSVGGVSHVTADY